MEQSKKSVLIGSGLLAVFLFALGVTLLLSKNSQIFKGRAASPGGTTLLCLNPVSGFSTAAFNCSAGTSTLAGTFDPDNKNAVVSVKINSNTNNEQITSFAFQLTIPQSAVGQPGTPVTQGIFNTTTTPGTRWVTQINKVDVDPNNASNWRIQFLAYYDRTNNTFPPVFTTDTSVVNITLPVVTAGQFTINFDGALSEAVDVANQQVLKTPVNVTANLAVDNVAAVPTFVSGPIDNFPASANTPVVYTYTATDTLSATGKIEYVAQFNNVNCPPGNSALYTPTTSFTTPTLNSGANTVTVCAADSSAQLGIPGSQVGKVTRTITFTPPVASVVLKVRFDGFTSGVCPASPNNVITATKVVIQDYVVPTVANQAPNPPAAHTFQQVYPNASGNAAVVFTCSGAGAFSATIGNLNLPSGTYDILVKGPSHLLTRVTGTGVNIAAGATNFSIDRTVNLADVVRAGDVVAISGGTASDGQDGKTTIEDLVALTGLFVNVSNPVPAGVGRRDIDKDGLLKVQDLTAILNNYKATTVYDDQ